MKTLRNFLFASILALTLCSSAFARDMTGGFCGGGDMTGGLTFTEQLVLTLSGLF